MRFPGHSGREFFSAASAQVGEHSSYTKGRKAMAYRLGKNRPVIDDRTIRFATYVKPALPSPPEAVSYGAKVTSWPMYLNDQYGDCTCAAAGHMIQNWTA